MKNVHKLWYLLQQDSNLSCTLHARSLPSNCPMFKFLNIGELAPKKYFESGIRVK